MKPAAKVSLLVLGALSALLIVSQFVMGMLILANPASERYRTMHQHSGYLTAAVVLVYVVGSMIAVGSIRPRGPSQAG